MKSNIHSLTLQQEAFCNAYLELGNASDAYRKAYENCKKWEPQSVHVAASKLLSVSKVSLRISALRADLAKDNKISLQTVLDELIQSANRSKEVGKERDVVNALSHISRILGLDKINHKVDQINAMSSEERRNRIETLRLKLEGLRNGDQQVM